MKKFNLIFLLTIGAVVFTGCATTSNNRVPNKTIHTGAIIGLNNTRITNGQFMADTSASISVDYDNSIAPKAQLVGSCSGNTVHINSINNTPVKLVAQLVAQDGNTQKCDNVGELTSLVLKADTSVWDNLITPDAEYKQVDYDAVGAKVGLQKILTNGNQYRFYVTGSDNGVPEIIGLRNNQEVLLNSIRDSDGKPIIKVDSSLNSFILTMNGNEETITIKH